MQVIFTRYNCHADKRHQPIFNTVSDVVSFMSKHVVACVINVTDSRFYRPVLLNKWALLRRTQIIFRYKVRFIHVSCRRDQNSVY